MALRWPQKSRASQLALIPILFTAIVCKAAQVGFDEEHPDASTQETLKEPQTFSKPRRRRRKLSLSANIMQDLGFDEGQKVMVLLVFLTIIILPVSACCEAATYEAVSFRAMDVFPSYIPHFDSTFASNYSESTPALVASTARYCRGRRR